MTKQEPETAFRTKRTAVHADGDIQTVDLPRAVVVSKTPGLAEIIARGVNAEGNSSASHLVMSLNEFAATPDLSLDELAICLFEIEQGNDSQLAALRTLKAMSAGATKFLGVTSEVLTLATARQLLDVGVDDVVPLGNISPQLSQSAPLADATDHAINQRAGTIHNGMIIGVAQTRGGIGATTFALNLATLLSVKPKQKRGAAVVEPPRVAIIDLDLQNGTLGASIDASCAPAFVEILRNGDIIDGPRLRQIMQAHPAGFDVLAAPAEFVPLTSMRPDMMASLLDELRLSYDYIVLDMPRTMVDWLDPVLARADKMFMLSDTAVHSVRQARRMIDFYSEDHVALSIDVCVSLERKPFSATAAIKEAEKFLDRKLAHWLPRDDRAAKISTDCGQPLLVSKRKSPIAKSMKPMVDELRTYFAADQRRQA